MSIAEGRYNLAASSPEPANRNLELMARELAESGHITPELWQMVLDEERTQASEILAIQEKGYAAIPRNYYPSSEGLRDVHGQELTKVFDDGADYTRRQVGQVPGANWELKRRLTERANLDKIINMPEGTILLEISATPSDKPESEQLAQHYNGLTMIRASIKPKGEAGRVRQYNYAIPLDDPEFLLAVQDKLGIKAENRTIDSQKLLETPIINSTEESAESSAREIDGLIGAALLEVSVGKSTVRMLTRAIEGRKEVWKFVNSDEHTDLDQELFAVMNYSAGLSAAQRVEAIKAIRTGYWKELKDRFSEQKVASTASGMAGGILYEAASRAVADGDVFIACGNTVQATEFSPAEHSQMIQRGRTEVKGSGACQACGAKGALFGCGLCGSCNKKWWDAYEATGKQTDIEDLAYRNQTRPETSKIGIMESAISVLHASWRETKQKAVLAEAA